MIPLPALLAVVVAFWNYWTTKAQRHSRWNNPATPSTSPLVPEAVTIKLIFAKGPSIHLRLLCLVFLAIVIMVTDYRTHALSLLRNGLSVLVYPIQYAVSLPSAAMHDLSESVDSYADLVAENKRLKKESLLNKTRLLKFEALEKKYIRLHVLLESSYQLSEQFMVAELVSVTLDPYDHVVLVNKGSRFGVFQGQPVIDASGIVGQVVRANLLNSEVMLITDPSHAVPVQVNRNGLRTIAIGSGQLNRLNLPFLPNNADIRDGDLLVTSGLGGIFPEGYPVATVTRVAPQPDRPFSLISAKPTASLDRSRELMMVWSNTTPIPTLGEEELPPQQQEGTTHADNDQETDDTSPIPDE